MKPLTVIPGGLRDACPQRVKPRHRRRRDPSSALVVLLCAAVLGLAGLFYFAAGIVSAWGL